jgi:predicted metal-dependent phosphoesterase TrpH
LVAGLKRPHSRDSGRIKMTQQRYMDLHTHTYYSDGIGTPELNVRTARLMGIEILAITDHDKIDGYQEAKIAGEKWQVRIIPGVEVSTDKYHILGLGINPYSEDFKKFLNYSAAQQKKVCIKRIEGLRAQGIPITLEKVMEAFPKSRLGKMNIQYTMSQDKECQDYFMKKDGQILTHELYNHYLENSKRKGSDKMTCITAKRAIKEIHAAGGIAIIAHPNKEIEDMHEMDKLLKYGLDGLEIQPAFNGKTEIFKKYAERHDLLITYGSDYHGGVFGRTFLGRGENILSKKLAKALGIK